MDVLHTILNVKTDEYGGQEGGLSRGWECGWWVGGCVDRGLLRVWIAGGWSIADRKTGAGGTWWEVVGGCVDRGLMKVWKTGGWSIAGGKVGLGVEYGGWVGRGGCDCMVDGWVGFHMKGWKVSDGMEGVVGGMEGVRVEGGRGDEASIPAWH